MVAVIRPKKPAACTLPLRIGRNAQWPDTSRYASWIDAARSGVRFRHDRSFAQSAAYLWICSPVVCASQRNRPGGFTPIITERSMLPG